MPSVARRLDLGFSANVVVVDEHHVLTAAAVEKAALDDAVRIKAELAQITPADIVLDAIVELTKLREYSAQVGELDLPEGAQDAPLLEQREPEVAFIRILVALKVAAL
ncbi:hypothetical protein V6L77_26010 [Pannonibacter sp. Pt2-lr]